MIQFNEVGVVYPNGFRALKGISLEIPKGQFVVVVGLSGAGKSTLIRTINNLVVPSSGEVLINGRSITKAKGRELRAMRTPIGMIFQTFNLVKRSTVLRNVLSGRLGQANPALSLLGIFSEADIALAHDCLRRVGIPDKAFVRADALSGGQQQRVGIARALAQDPEIMLADEPVASLDPPTSHAVMSDLKRISREDGITTLVNLHFIDMARDYADRIIGMRGGEVVFDGTPAEATNRVFEEIYGRPIDKERDLRGAA
ncbi:phosphonate ABC transporter ATP-binding protein [Truepera radiovictrix]|uniref:Phosphonate ABC transporter, ATPase subunit n=1 Tax=Truepera radiovictrix (strain DSM 17093 / CIP 108686 / LMG 22925 / RQ-24) TaxID=649638 RepID=D7CQP3_TRURR|nr:phosphonate ABC transporter ATP-binding protein [Truepera radiovictrix]ADI15027.1 phosphonate ABC transporter, ATPase subunit [Truepera radiovictrix DSM 17093]WMT56420.1 phosphonate ABC transporter ATP-binding protein [Truepera radiovictrix]